MNSEGRLSNTWPETQSFSKALTLMTEGQPYPVTGFSRGWRRRQRRDYLMCTSWISFLTASNFLQITIREEAALKKLEVEVFNVLVFLCLRKCLFK